jgi:hypothetical protein
MAYAHEVPIIEAFQLGKDMHCSVASKTWLSGYPQFKTQEEIFKFIMESPRFKISDFYYENLNAKNRKRNKKRDSYGAFLKYVEKNPYQPNIILKTDDIIEQIEIFFPNSDLKRRIRDIIRKNRKREMRIRDAIGLERAVVQ